MVKVTPNVKSGSDVLKRGVIRPHHAPRHASAAAGAPSAYPVGVAKGTEKGRSDAAAPRRGPRDKGRTVKQRPVDSRTAIPTPVRVAGWIASIQGLVGVCFAVYLVIHAAMGYEEATVEISGYGTAGWFFLIAGPVLAAGLGLLRGKRWGRGLVILAELLLIGVAWYAASGSAQYVAAVIVGGTALVALFALFRDESIEWYEG